MNQVTATERTTQVWQRRGFTLLLAAFTALVLCYFIGLFVYAPMYVDQSWLLYAAQRMLTGVHLYGTALVETNPPLIVWFSTIPAYLGQLLHIDAYATLKIVVFLMIIGSVAWCVRILRITGLAQSPARLLIATASVLSAEIFMNGYIVGQREHLVIILILPYILSAVLSSSGTQSRLSFAEHCALGITAGIAVCFKPQQVLILIGLELFLAIWMRSLHRLLSPDFLCAVLAIIVYIGTVSVATPLYFTSTLPLLRETYWGFGRFSTWDLIKQEPVFDLLFVLTVFTLAFRWKKPGLKIIPAAFLVCSLAASIALYAQHTGADYRAYPQVAMLALAIFWIGMNMTPNRFLADWEPDSSFAFSTLVIGFLLLPPTIAMGRVLKRIQAPDCRIPAQVFSGYPPKTPVIVLSTGLDEFPAIENDHLVWASRNPYLWMLPAIIRNELFEAGGPRPKRVLPPALVKSLAAKTRTETAEDFRRWKPSVVMVEECHKYDPCFALRDIDFDTLKWLLQSPAFAAAWAHYRFQTKRENYDVYTRTD